MMNCETRFPEKELRKLSRRKGVYAMVPIWGTGLVKVGCTKNIYASVLEMCNATPIGFENIYTHSLHERTSLRAMHKRLVDTLLQNGYEPLCIVCGGKKKKLEWFRLKWGGFEQVATVIDDMFGS